MIDSIERKEVVVKISHLPFHKTSNNSPKFISFSELLEVLMSLILFMISNYIAFHIQVACFSKTNKVFDMVPEAGLEPARYFYRGILSPLCLPIPPLGQTVN